MKLFLVILVIFGGISFIITYIQTKDIFRNLLLRTVIAFLASCFIGIFTTMIYDLMKGRILKVPFETEEKYKEASVDEPTVEQKKSRESEASTEIIAENPDIENAQNETKYLENMRMRESGNYEENEGDSFMYKIGQHKYTRGNIDVDGNTYEHGLEAWIARWNYIDEKSWAYSTFELEEKYTRLNGRCVLIDSYNTEFFNSTLFFYGDGNLINEYLLVPENIPFEIELDVAGIEELKVYVGDNIAVSGGTSFGLIDLILE